MTKTILGGILYPAIVEEAKLSGVFDGVLQEIDEVRKESRKIEIENAIFRVKAAVEELEFALFEFNGIVDQEFIYKLALVVKARVQYDSRESELNDFFIEFDNKLEALQRHNNECAQTGNADRFKHKQSVIVGWFDANVPGEIPDIIASSYRRILSDFNSTFWSRI